MVRLPLQFETQASEVSLCSLRISCSLRSPFPLPPDDGKGDACSPFPLPPDDGRGDAFPSNNQNPSMPCHHRNLNPPPSPRAALPRAGECIHIDSPPCVRIRLREGAPGVAPPPSISHRPLPLPLRLCLSPSHLILRSTNALPCSGSPAPQRHVCIASTDRQGARL